METPKQTTVVESPRKCSSKNLQVLEFHCAQIVITKQKR